VPAPTYDRDFWEQLWSRTLREHADVVAQRPPNATLLAELGGLPPGRALDAGCGHGSETLWLAAQGWHVTALDFSASALAHGRASAQALGPHIADRIDWVEGDLADWAPDPAAYDLVTSLYVHIAGSVPETLARIASGVAPGGTLFVLGHQPVDPVTGAATPAAGQVQVSVDDARAVLRPADWQLQIAEERERAQAGSGVDAVVVARRRP
jgi:SAM-dependent methyltransferase